MVFSQYDYTMNRYLLYQYPTSVKYLITSYRYTIFSSLNLLLWSMVINACLYQGTVTDVQFKEIFHRSNEMICH